MLSRTIKKPESVGEERVKYFVIVPRVRFLFKNRKSVHFCTDFRQIVSSKPHNFSQSYIYIFCLVIYFSTSDLVFIWLSM